MEGVEHQFDAIVFATGFDVSKTGTPIPITGRDSRVLADEWSAGAQGVQEHCGIGLPEHVLHLRPELRPGTQLGIGVHGGADRLHRRGDLSWYSKEICTVLDVRQDVQDAYNEDLQRRLAKTTWNSGCTQLVSHRGRLQRDHVPGFRHPVRRTSWTVDLGDYTVTARGTTPR